MKTKKLKKLKKIKERITDEKSIIYTILFKSVNFFSSVLSHIFENLYKKKIFNIYVKKKIKFISSYKRER